MFRRSTETKNTEVEVEPTAYLGSSQSEVLNTKPDYQKILQNQNKVFDCMELVVSWVMFLLLSYPALLPCHPWKLKDVENMRN